jgi:hypothetical protein
MDSLYEVMSKRKWLKGMIGSNVDNSACLVGGVSVALTGDVVAFNQEFTRECERLGEVAERLFPERLVGLHPSFWKAVWFNNHPETTREEMLKVCKAYDEEKEFA